MVSINKNVEPGRCMVVGCEGKALYRGRQAKNGRGYCRAHKQLAVVVGNTHALADFLAQVNEYPEVRRQEGE